MPKKKRKNAILTDPFQKTPTFRMQSMCRDSLERLIRQREEEVRILKDAYKKALKSIKNKQEYIVSLQKEILAQYKDSS